MTNWGPTRRLPMPLQLTDHLIQVISRTRKHKFARELRS